MGRKTTLFSIIGGGLFVWSPSNIQKSTLFYFILFSILRFDSEKIKHALGLLQTNGVTSFSVGGKRDKRFGTLPCCDLEAQILLHPYF